MFIQNTDLFKDLGAEATYEISEAMVEESCEKGFVLYTQRDPARHCYILVEGRVRLTIGQGAEINYTVTKPGEVFGWSSMVDRKFHAASAECVTASKVVKIERDTLNRIFEKDPFAGMTFFRRLAAAVVQRLIESHEAFFSECRLEGITSFGTGQVSDTREE